MVSSGVPVIFRSVIFHIWRLNGLSVAQLRRS
nr:MAG TPA: hypothetical protein [Caudoviricetes sp.]